MKNKAHSSSNLMLSFNIACMFLFLLSFFFTSFIPANAEEIDDLSGIYQIVNVGSGKVLDIKSGSLTAKSNVQQYDNNSTVAQYWRIEKTENDEYTIVNSFSGLALDVASASKNSGANVWIYNFNGSTAQKWCISENEDGTFEITSSLSGMSLDVASGSKKNGANVQVYTSNGSKAQKWELVKLDQPIEDGLYTITSAISSSMAIDVKSASYNNSAKIQLYSSNNSSAQKWRVVHNDKTGFYELISARSGKVLDVPNGSRSSGTKLQQYTSNNSKAQAWILEENSDGSITIKSAISGLSVDVPSGSAKSNQQLQIWSSNASNAQKWYFNNTSINLEGIYAIQSTVNLSNVLDVLNASTSENAQVQVYSSNNTLAQKWELTRASDDEDIYFIRNANSGRYLTDTSGVLSSLYDRTEGAQWNVVIGHEGYVFTNMQTGRVLDLQNGSSSSKTKVQTYSANGSKAQSWRLTSTKLVTEGLYVITNRANSSQALDVPSGSLDNGVALQTYKANGSGAQSWYVESTGDGWYSLINLKSGKAVDVKNGSSNPGAVIWQYTSNGTDAQKWKFEIAALGGIKIVSAKGDLAMTADSDSPSNGTKVITKSALSAASQGWKFTATSANDASNIWNDSSYIEKMRLKAIKWGDNTTNRPSENGNTVKDQSGKKVAAATGWMCTVDVDKGRVCVFRKSGSTWALVKSFNTTAKAVTRTVNGVKKSRSFSGVWTVHHKAIDLYADESYTNNNAAKYGCARYWTCYVEAYTSAKTNHPGTNLINRKCSNGKYEDGQGFHEVTSGSTAGCTGLKVGDSKYIYDNVPVGSAVVVFGSYDGDKY